MVSYDEIVLGPFKTLNGDAMLAGATYLNGSNKISKGVMKRDGAKNPYITFEVRPEQTAGEQQQVEEVLLRMLLSLDADADYNANVARASMIETRIAALMDLQILSGATGVSYLSCVKVGSLIPLRVDNEALNSAREHLFVMQYRLSVGKQ